MNASEFLTIALEEWQLLVLLVFLSSAFLWFCVHRLLIAGIFDPFALAYVLGFGIKYGIVAFLYIGGLISGYLAGIILVFGALFLACFNYFSRKRSNRLLTSVIVGITAKGMGRGVLQATILLYLIISAYIIFSVGFGIFAVTNRFDAARGFGAYIRVLDLISPFLVAYGSLKIASSSKGRGYKVMLLGIFIVFAALLNGAKISILFSLLVSFFALKLAGYKLKIGLGKLIGVGVLGGGFLFAALSINLDRNNVTAGDIVTDISGVGLVVERFVYRMIANGNTSYLILPNGVIDRLETDNIAARFVVPFIGITGSSRLFGYDTGRYSVGRQALLYYNPWSEVAGGPTSKFDMFAYVYLGPIGGAVFVLLLASLLGTIGALIKSQRINGSSHGNDFRIAFLAALWSRSILMIIEPATGFAYIVDAVLLFGVLSHIASLGRRNLSRL